MKQFIKENRIFLIVALTITVLSLLRISNANAHDRLVVLWFAGHGTWAIDSFANLEQCKTQAKHLGRVDPTPRDLTFNTPTSGKYLCLPEGQRPW